MRLRTSIVAAALCGALVSCGDNQSEGPEGPSGPVGPRGEDGENGTNGMNGSNGENGQNGNNGQNGAACGQGGSSTTSTEGVPATAPLASVIALTYCDAANTGAANLADYVKTLVRRYGTNTLPAGFQFPLAAASTDSVRAIRGMVPDVVIKWLDPLTWDNMTGPATTPRFGANADYIAYFGDGWEAGGTPYWQGSDSSAWMWVNHEYISNSKPRATAAPTGQHLVLARFLSYWGVLSGAPAAGTWSANDLTVYGDEYKKQVGGTWMHLVQDPATAEWVLDRAKPARRYDATDATQVKVTGLDVSPDHDDLGAPLPEDVVVGIQSDCSGGVTPWGTVITAEENVAFSYGDLESVWTSSQKFTPGVGFDPGTMVTYDVAPSPTADFASPDPTASHPKDAYGFLVEMDPGAPPAEYYGKTTPGVGHRKLGAAGRANWENATFVTGADWKLLPGQPIVLYAGNDRRGGHIYKFVTSRPYTAGMTKAQTRALLDAGTLYVAHFAGLDSTQGRRMASTMLPPSEAAPGQGRWIELSITSTALAPNAAALGEPSKTVGQALADTSWNQLAGYPDDAAVRKSLFTAALKIGVMELNRPEDIEWNPRDLSGTPRLYVAFTNHDRQVALDALGRLFAPATHSAMSPNRGDKVGGIFAMQEALPSTPGSSQTFTFWQVWAGSDAGGLWDAADPDNIVVDAGGGLWFGTDGNFGTTLKRSADAIYYLDLDPAHRTVATPSFGKAFRVVAMPSDAETTGPAFSAGMGTLFVSVQHPGEDQQSSWPQR